jgi:hypothetical protein
MSTGRASTTAASSWVIGHPAGLASRMSDFLERLSEQARQLVRVAAVLTYRLTVDQLAAAPARRWSPAPAAAPSFARASPGTPLIEGSARPTGCEEGPDSAGR